MQEDPRQNLCSGKSHSLGSYLWRDSSSWFVNVIPASPLMKPIYNSLYSCAQNRFHFNGPYIIKCISKFFILRTLYCSYKMEGKISNMCCTDILSFKGV